MPRLSRPSRRGQTALPWLIGGAVVLGGLGLLLSWFSAGDEDVRPVRTSYLDDDQGVIARRRAERQETTREAAALVLAAREATRRRIRASSKRSTASFARIFRSGGPQARYQDERSGLAELLASPDVLYRLLGTDAGDFVYHRTRGWLRYVDGGWVPVDPRAFPRELAEAYPRLVPVPGQAGPPVDPNQVGGDGVFAAPGWLVAEEGA